MSPIKFSSVSCRGSERGRDICLLLFALFLISGVTVQPVGEVEGGVDDPERRSCKARWRLMFNEDDSRRLLIAPQLLTRTLFNTARHSHVTRLPCAGDTHPLPHLHTHPLPPRDAGVRDKASIRRGIRIRGGSGTKQTGRGRGPKQRPWFP